MPVQNTFTLVSEARAAASNAPARPMTSKQVKKAHKAANKQPKLSRMEQRKMELAEQERIRKELEKDRQAARARAARERKKAKEEEKREAKRKSGKPLVDVRPSQDTISRFFRGNGSGKKRDGRGEEVGKMDVIAEESEPGRPTPQVREEESGEDEAQREEVQQEETYPEEAHREEFRQVEAQEEDVGQEEVVPQELQQELDEERIPTQRGANDATNTVLGDYEGIRVEEKGPGKTMAVNESFGEFDMDEDFMVELDAMEATPASSHYSTRNTPSTERPAACEPEKSTQNPWTSGDMSPAHIFGDDINDDLLANSLNRKEVASVEEARSLEPKADAPTSHRPGLSEAEKDDMDDLDDDLEDEALQELGAMFSQRPVASSPVYSPERKLPEDPDATLPELKQTPTPPKDKKVGRDSSSRKRREFSSFAEDDLDEELLQQLDGPREPEEQPASSPGNADTTADTIVDLPAKIREPTTYEKDLGLDLSSSPSPPRQQPPLSTQAILFNLDDYFPSPSQQERELDIEEPAHRTTQPTPCPPPRKAPRLSQLRSGGPPKSTPPQQKRFFSASGSNELFSLALHRSRRTAALENIHEQERQRYQAGMVLAKQRAEVARPQSRGAALQKCTATATATGTCSSSITTCRKTQSATVQRPLKPAADIIPSNASTAPRPPPPFKQSNPAPHKPQTIAKPPTFIPPAPKPVSPPTGNDNKENNQPPLASQESEYGGNWIDEMADELTLSGDGLANISTTHIGAALDTGNDMRLR